MTLTPTLPAAHGALPPRGARPCLGRLGAAAMAIYRIKLTMGDGSRGRYTGLIADGFEAVLQTLADFPEARSVAAMFIRRAGA